MWDKSCNLFTMPGRIIPPYEVDILASVLQIKNMRQVKSHSQDDIAREAESGTGSV